MMRNGRGRREGRENVSEEPLTPIWGVLRIEGRRGDIRKGRDQIP